jgi:hypothetical protein
MVTDYRGAFAFVVLRIRSRRVSANGLQSKAAFAMRPLFRSRPLPPPQK